MVEDLRQRALPYVTDLGGVYLFDGNYMAILIYKELSQVNDPPEEIDFGIAVIYICDTVLVYNKLYT